MQQGKEVSASGGRGDKGTAKVSRTRRGGSVGGSSSYVSSSSSYVASSSSIEPSLNSTVSPPVKTFPPHPRKSSCIKWERRTKLANKHSLGLLVPKGDGSWATEAEVKSAARLRGHDCRKMLFETTARFCVLPVFGPGCPPWDDRGCTFRMVGTVNGACAHWVCRKLPARSRGHRRRSTTTSTTAATTMAALAAAASSPTSHASVIALAAATLEVRRATAPMRTTSGLLRSPTTETTLGGADVANFRN